MNKSSSVSFIGDRNSRPSRLDNARSAEALKICNIVVRDMHALLQGMFDGIDDSFFELANNARNNNEQNRFFEAMRDIRIKRKNIENDFKSSIEAQFSLEQVLTPSSKLNAPVEPKGFESLSLVQNDDLEEEVAISSMATKAQANFQGPLLQFHTRICNLYGCENNEDANLPLGLKDVIESFTSACEVLEIELKERLVVFKQFDRYVLSNLGPVLDEANKTLIRLGIMPSLKAPRTKQGSKTASSPHDKSTHASEDTTAKQQNTTNVLPQLQNLLANIRNNLGPQALSADYNPGLPTQYVSTQDLISLLSAIQGIAPSTNNSADSKVINIHQQLKAQLSQGSDQPTTQPKFKQIDEDLINLVSMLFEFILEDYNLAAPIQVLISRLQIPILKVVIKDNSFFSSSKHPARKLLNSLAKAGIGWNETQNKGDALYQAIFDTVQNILDNFTGDIQLFEKLYEEFSAFVKKEEKKSKIVEQRTKESEIGQIKSRQAQKCVEDKLDSLLDSSQISIPDLVLETIRGGWSRVMFLAYLKDEEEHQWEHSCKTAENLIWCLQPFEKPKDRQYWIAIAPKVLKELKSGLEEVSYNTADLDQALVEIRSTLTNTFKQNSFNLSHNIVPPVNEENEPKAETAIERQQASIDSSLNKYIEQIEQIEVGTWFEFTNNDSKQRCKLSAVINDADSYIFVNRMGLKSCEKTKTDLANDLKRKHAIVLEQGLLIDRAMNALTSSLSQKASTL